MEIRFLALLIKDRIKESQRTQKVMSDFMHVIKTRIGSHEVSEDINSRIGTIILQLTGDPKEWDKLEEALNNIGGIEVKSVSFNI